MKNALTISKSEATVDEDSFLGKLIAGTQGKVTIKTPYGRREIKTVKDKKGKKIK